MKRTFSLVDEQSKVATAHHCFLTGKRFLAMKSMLDVFVGAMTLQTVCQLFSYKMLPAALDYSICIVI